MRFIELTSNQGIDLDTYTYSYVTVGQGFDTRLIENPDISVVFPNPPPEYSPTWGIETDSVIFSCIFYEGNNVEFMTEIIGWDRINNRSVSYPNFPYRVGGNSSYSGVINVTFKTYSIVLVGYPIIRLGLNNENKPSYYDLVSGYPLDNRNITTSIDIIPSITEEVTFNYYRQNTLEPVPGLVSIDWHSIKLNLIKNIPIKITLKNIVLGTLSISSASVQNKITSLDLPAYLYPTQYLFKANLGMLFNHWRTLYDQINNSNLPAINAVFNDSRILHKLAANNDIWENTTLSNSLDINFDLSHPMFTVNAIKAYDWHIKGQLFDKGIGDLKMDSPRTIEIHAALDAAKWGANPDDPTTPRLINLGWFIERIAWFFGIRPKPNGKIDTIKDKASVRQVINKNKVLDPEKIGVNSFGEDGMVLTRINNRFKGNEIVSDQCVIVKDFIQIVQEYFEQTNLALGIQESSAIEIKRDKTTARFNNQLEILVELLNLMSSGNEMIRANLVSSLVTQSQSNELIAGLGLPSVTKTIPLKIEDKIYHLPYKGIAAHRSISQEIATCTYNVGLVTGQLL